MTLNEIEQVLIPHLRGQFERALPILFTGAGFSSGAKNVGNEGLPSYEGLKGLLWELCFPGSRMEDGTSLQTLYEHALLRHPRQLTELLQRTMTVEANSLPDWYRTIFSVAWFRSYTLNVDDLAVAVSRRFKLPRNIRAISATGSATTAMPAEEVPAQGLEVVYLNGTLSDLPDNVTFSVTQYGERLARPEPSYVRLTADLLSRSFVFIGTRLEEPPLWQHIELRRMKGRQLRELRPRSYLVTPRLDLARQALLAEFNVVWVPMSAEEFVKAILEKMDMASRAGLDLLSRRAGSGRQTPGILPEVAELARQPAQPTDFLLGEEPVWADLQAGRAIARESDEELWKGIQNALARPGPRGIIAVTGTAASGKSTGLMRACLRLAAEGIRVGWVDRESDLSPRDIRAAIRSDDPPSAIAFDDGDLYGTYLSPLIREVALNRRAPLVLICMRSGKLDRAVNTAVLEGVPIDEFSMPPLADSDISALLDVLDRENRLGLLKGTPRKEQERIFKEKAGRQLIVAMIEATSGRRFEEKAVDELLELQPEGQRVYALIGVASAFRFGLSKDEILVATGDATNAMLNAIDLLTRRHVLRSGHDGLVWARHRVIAEIIRDEMQKIGRLAEVLSGIAFVAATKVSPDLHRSARPWRILRPIINHEYLIRVLEVESTRNLYGSLEQILSWDFHYWLQRGSFEVEVGNLALAENFLNQSRGLAPDDPYVETEWAYLLFRKANANPQGHEAPDLVREATTLLQDLVERPGLLSPYPYHVLGSQGLAWARRGIATAAEKGRYLSNLIRQIQDGNRKCRRNELEALLKDLNQEYLGLAVSR
jgi:SIR2-like domain